MPSAVKDMVIGGPQKFRLKTPACFSSTGFFQAPFNGSSSTGMHKNFYCTKKVGNYLIGKTLGEGSFAKVREGLHVITEEKVAIKVIDKHKVKNDAYVTKNLYREGYIQQKIRHPNIAQLLDIMETDNNYYLVMELCVGGNLLNRIYEKRQLEEREAQKYIRQLIMAVEHLHRAGVVHRDLKIENLLLDENDNIKLIDFGLSNSAGILGYTDPLSTQCGSPAYAAPELLNGQKYGPKVDVWSIGVNLYAMLTGMLPFTVEPFSLTLLHEKMMNKEINPIPPDLSTGAVMLLRYLLEPDPAKRPTIYQVVTNQWVHNGQVPSYLNRLNNRDINHVVIQHMTEKLGYKYCDVLSTVNLNRASSVLATYFLLNKKMERRLKPEPLEKEKPKEQNPTRWAAANEKSSNQPMQEPSYLAALQNQDRDTVLNPGRLRPEIHNKVSILYPGGTVHSSSRAYPDKNPLMLHTPQPDLRHLQGQAQGGRYFPTSSHVISVPTSAHILGIPTSSRVIVVPDNANVLGIPTSWRFIGVSADANVMGISTSSRVIGAPAHANIIGIPTSSRVLGVPDSANSIGIPTSSRFMGYPTSSRVMGFPTSSRVIGVPDGANGIGIPTSSRIMGYPTSSRVMGFPTSSRVIGVPASANVMGIPTSSRVIGVPASANSIGIPTSSRIMGYPTSSRVMGFPTSSRVIGVPASANVMGIPTSSRVIGVPASANGIGIPTSSRIMGYPTSSRVMGFPISSHVIGVPASANVMGIPTSSRVIGVPASANSIGIPTSSRVMGYPTSSRVMGYSRDRSFQEMNARQVPPWLRVGNGPLPQGTHFSNLASTPTPRPGPPILSRTKPGVHARQNVAYTNPHRDRFLAMGTSEDIKKHNPLPSTRYKPWMEPTNSPTLSTNHMQRLANPRSPFRTIS